FPLAFTQVDDWQEYVSGILRETKERDRQPLGGVRPHGGQQIPMHPGMGLGNAPFAVDEADGGLRALSAGDIRNVNDNGELQGEVYVSEGDVASDQFARYLSQQIVNDVPDRFLPGEGSDDEDDDKEWIGEFESKDIGFEKFVNKQSSAGLDVSSNGELKDAFNTSDLIKGFERLSVASTISNNSTQAWADFSKFTDVNANDLTPPVDEVTLPTGK
ncbi:hypothetical protein HK096_008177, partial [Nowakowskiella sp. JEL0078]